MYLSILIGYNLNSVSVCFIWKGIKTFEKTHLFQYLINKIKLISDLKKPNIIQ